MQKITIFMTALLFAINISAQGRCEISIDQSPKLLGLKLGVTPIDASNLLEIKVFANPKGQSTFFKNYIKKKSKGKLSGVRALYLRFYENEVYQIEIFYDKKYKWQTLDGFILDYSSKNNFPVNFWKTEYGYSKAICKGFSLDADYILNPHIQLTNDLIAKQIEAIREEEESNKDSK